MKTTTHPIAVAIDGPSGAGKSTVAKILAKELQFIYVDTGALYRAVGYTALKQGVSIYDAAAVEAMLPSLTVSLGYENGEQRVYVNGDDVTAFIRTPEVSEAASAVSAVPSVRQFLFELQQNMAKTSSVIMDGRDIGTVVLPDAQVKIFLTASVEVRAKRRFDELIEKGMDVTYEDVLSDMIQRDKRDSERATAPLKPAEDAVLVDTSDNTLEEAVARMRALVEEKLV
ncbi:MAG: (d)CMP kinase [Ruminococcaceae bacterium]|nr:(d)CMP kinase [Oscillospiraceae bacterium]